MTATRSCSRHRWCRGADSRSTRTTDSQSLVVMPRQYWRAISRMRDSEVV
ncbi:hypothetical protein [Acidipropionibacterium jensenii]|nr:hypothetical protein [Acidipropionibacterium jensenii]MDN5976904.1 hypothetical protein [Acidipropionibacterium jensenii]MDN5995865.1 hypothetical protein [Acidipropionibacterium jensenii]MDN6426287.1 hypothetical protein [Acidipropionibacterium jensenii]MDN6441024.1 hypothetical protein [Acidipropionibacterium jensenii]MDN6480208.1 hypothetical protein [Acidipropionibacterium jensenii]